MLVLRQGSGAFKGKRGGSEGAPPARSLGRSLELFDDARIGRDACGGPMPGPPVRLGLCVEHGRERTVDRLSLG